MANPKRYVPEWGHIVWLDFDLQAGHEQAKRRPALVLSPLEYNEKVGLAIFCPITSKIKGYPFEVGVPLNIGLKEKGVVLSAQVKSLDWKARNVTFIDQVSPATLDEVFAKLSTLFQ